jgi:hypothetical protein
MIIVWQEMKLKHKIGNNYLKLTPTYTMFDIEVLNSFIPIGFGLFAFLAVLSDEDCFKSFIYLLLFMTAITILILKHYYRQLKESYPPITFYPETQQFKHHSMNDITGENQILLHYSIANSDDAKSSELKLMDRWQLYYLDKNIKLLLYQREAEWNEWMVEIIDIFEQKFGIVTEFKKSFSLTDNSEYDKEIVGNDIKVLTSVL